jgi:hypothetical protein
MRTARIEIDQQLLFELIGLKNMDANIVNVETYNTSNRNTMRLSILGNDDRLPDSADYPDCMVTCTRIESHIEKA